jgi:hypothetical protein
MTAGGEMNCATTCHQHDSEKHREKRSMDDKGKEKDLEENTKRSSPGTSSEQLIAYNLSEVERPGRLKVRFKIRIVTGKQAALLDERQALAIRGLLEWTMHYRAQQEGSR